MTFERDDYMPDGNTAALRDYEIRADRADAEFNRKLVTFRVAPFEACEWVLDQFDKKDLLDAALVTILADFDTEAAANHRASQCSLKDLHAALEQAVWSIDE